jgi:enoyl-CoA hydratase/carnithine racemase
MKKALEMILTGDPISADEAYRLGLVNLVVPPDRLDDEVEGFLKRLTDKSAVVLKWAKKAVMSGWDLDFERALQNSEIIYKYCLMETEDAKEGLSAFLEKRSPTWSNR